jgi:5-methylcytosine-specific restriction endonuclease McrA
MRVCVGTLGVACGVLLVPGVNWRPYLARTSNYICDDCRRTQRRAAAEKKRRVDPEGWSVASGKAYAARRLESDPAYWSRRRKESAGYRIAHDAYHARKMNALLVGDLIDRRVVWGRDEGHCRIRLPGCWGFVPFEEMHLDHIVPLARGGSHSWNNVQTGCPPCNCAKQDRLLEMR